MFGTDTVQIATGGSTRATVDSSGNFGIGTSSPQSDLHVEDASATCSLSIVAGDSTSNSNIQFGDQDDINVGLISYNHTDNALSMRTSGSGTDLLIDSSGRLLVGDSSDSSDSLLIVQGNAGDSGTGGQISVQRGGSANPTSPSELGNIAFKDSAASRGAVISAVCDGDWASNDFPTRLEFKTTADNASSPTERMRISSSGAVSIGTTNNTPVV